MAIIGKFEPYNGQYHGQIETIRGQIGVRFVPTNATAADASAFKLSLTMVASSAPPGRRQTRARITSA
jgi:uncharacterized protein (DUF736 family)